MDLTAGVNLVDGSSAGTIVNSKGVLMVFRFNETLQIAGTWTTSTAAELNILDGVTSTAAELNIPDGATSADEQHIRWCHSNYCRAQYFLDE